MSILENFIMANFICFSMVCALTALFYILFNRVHTKGRMLKYALLLMFFTSFGFYAESYLKNSPSAGLLKVLFTITVIISCSRIVLNMKYFQIILAAVIYAFSANISMIMITFLQSLFGISVEQVKNSFPMFLSVYCLMDLSIFLILFTLNTIKKVNNINIPTEIKNNYLKNLFPSVFIVVCIILVNSYIITVYNSIVMRPITILSNIVFLTSFFVLSLTNLNNVLKLSIKDSELELQNLYNEKMNVFIDEIMRIKSNYKNTISTLDGYVSLKEWENLELYFKELFSQSISIESMQRIISLDIKNPALFGIISSKMGLAAEKDLFFDVKNHSKIVDWDAGIYSLCDILGCLMDNAIEAAYLSRSKSLAMKISLIEGNYCFRIENSFFEAPDINKIFMKGVSTKGDTRGNGLWYVKNKVDKDENLILNTIIEKNLFIQELILQNQSFCEIENPNELTQAEVF